MSFKHIISTTTATATSSIRKFTAAYSTKSSIFRSPKQQSNISIFDQPRVSILTEISNQPGSLHECLRYFWKYDIDMTHIESRPVQKGTDGFLIQIDFAGTIGEVATDKLLSELAKHCKNTLILDGKVVPWFPKHVRELDLIANKTLDAGADLESDHPGFNDQVYRTRRHELASLALNYKCDDVTLPYIKYTDDEVKTWGLVYKKLESLQKNYACREYNDILKLMETHCGYSHNNIPQAEDISNFLKEKTGFRLRPVAGLLSSRDFLNGLAYKVFFSTQYIRHHSMPLYTPEPDICHELLGHAPMFYDSDFAEFSQEIGLASLGASDAEILKLATCYWFSVEFGLLKENGNVKAYGAGLLSSFGELEYACNKDIKYDAPTKAPIHLPWDPIVASNTTYPICTYQPTYFVAESLQDAKKKMRTFCEHLPRPFHARYNSLTASVWVDRSVKRF